MTFLMWFIGLPLGIMIWCYAAATLVNMVDDFGEDVTELYQKLKEKYRNFSGTLEQED
jgi:hypothetical protein